MDHRSVSQEARLRLHQLSELPPLHSSALRLIHAVQDPDIEIQAIAQILDQDPPLSARLIGLANSAFFGVPSRVTSAEEAIVKVLGLNTAKNLALAIVVSGTFEARRVPGFHPDDYWLTAVSVAVLAQRLAPHVTVEPRPTATESYLGGLLHNIGVLALAHVHPVAMAEVFAGRAGTELPLATAERELLGVDHLEAGGLLARRWHLPAAVIAAIEFHANPAYDGPFRPHAQLVGWCAQQVRRPERTPTEGAGRLAALGITPRSAQAALASFERDRDTLAAMARGMAG